MYFFLNCQFYNNNSLRRKKITRSFLHFKNSAATLEEWGGTNNKLELQGESYLNHCWQECHKNMESAKLV